MSYAIERKLQSSQEKFDVVEQVVVDKLKEKGFGILTRIDVKNTLKEKLGIETKPYVILGACNPPRAHKALSVEPNVGVLLPCNVVVYANDEGTLTVSAMNPTVAMEMINNGQIDQIAKEVESIMVEVLDEIASLGY